MTMRPPLERKKMYEELTDDELVTRYLGERSESIFRDLVDRHHDRLYSRFIFEVKNPADATDLEQQLWLQVFRNLPNYKPEGKFANYLSRIAGNLLNDFWRSNSRRAEVFAENQPNTTKKSDGEEQTDVGGAAQRAQGPDQETTLDNEVLVKYLVTELIPQLPVEQRLAWLLRHESEYWEPGQRLEWHHLAELNGVEQDEIWQRFESARYKLLIGMQSCRDEHSTLYRMRKHWCLWFGRRHNDCTSSNSLLGSTFRSCSVCRLTP